MGRGKRKHALGGKDAEEGRRTTDGRKGIHAPSHKHRMPNYEEALHAHTPAAAIPGIPKAGTPLSDPLLGQKQGFQQFRTMFSCRVRGRPVFSQIFVCYPPWGPSDPLLCHPQPANCQPCYRRPCRGVPQTYPPSRPTFHNLVLETRHPQTIVEDFSHLRIGTYIYVICGETWCLCPSPPLLPTPLLNRS